MRTSPVCRRDGDRYIVWLGDERLGFVRHREGGTWNAGEWHATDATMARSKKFRIRGEAVNWLLQCAGHAAPPEYTPIKSMPQ